MVCGMVLGAIALGNGEISLVEPLLATNLLFALALSRHQTRQPLGRQGWAGLLPARGRGDGVHRGGPARRAATPSRDPLRHWLIIGVMVGLALLLTAYAKRVPAERRHRCSSVAGRRTPLRRPGRAHPGERPALLRRRLGRARSPAGRPTGSWCSASRAWYWCRAPSRRHPCGCHCPRSPRRSRWPGSPAGSGFLGDRLRTDAGALAWEAVGLAGDRGRGSCCSGCIRRCRRGTSAATQQELRPSCRGPRADVDAGSRRPRTAIRWSRSADEILDIVDENDEVIGQAPRGEAYARGLRHRCVFIQVRDADGRLFVHRRTPTKLVFPSLYDMFVGGVVGAGETYDDAALREAEEELGVSGLPRPTLLFKFLYDDGAGQSWWSRRLRGALRAAGEAPGRGGRLARLPPRGGGGAAA